MTLSDLSIKRPVLTLVFAIAIIIFGIVAFTTLGVREYPSVDPPIISVRTDYPGANAQIIESQITEPIEDYINRVDGIKNINSISSVGRSTVRVEFELGRDLDNAANDVRDMVSQAIRSLPPDVEPPIVSKADADATTILAITIQSPQRSLLELTEIAENVFEERLQTIEGVSRTYIWGSKRYAMRLYLDMDLMAAYNISPMDVKDALAKQNIELPSGQIEGKRKYLSIQTYGRLNTEDDFNNLVIAHRDNSIIRLKDIGNAKLSASNLKSILRGNKGIPMVGVAIQPQPGANYIDIVDEAYKRVEMLKKEIPEDFNIGVGLDVTNSIRKSIRDVQYTIILAFMLVLIIILIFLKNFRTTFIPIIAIPISLIGSFAFIYAAGFSINILSLLGLLLATGMVVDDAIVMMENIYAKIEQGMEPVQAAFKGSRQVFFAIISTTITLMSVFLPIFFMEGFTGRLFREFALVVTGSILVSTFISLSLTVMLSSRLLKSGYKEYKLLQWLNKPIDYTLKHYKSWLVKFMRYRYLSFFVILITAALIYVFMINLSQELAPLDDKGNLRLISTAPEGTSYEMMDDYQKELIQYLDTFPEKEYLLSVTSPGFGASVSVNSGFVRIMLKDPSERNKSQMQLAREINKKMQDFKMAQTYVIQSPTIEGAGGGGGRLPVQFVLQAPSLEKLEEYIPEFLNQARNHPALDIVDIDLKFNKPEIMIEINREKAFELGISVREIAQTIQTFFSQQRIGYFIKSGKQYDVIAQAKDNQRYTPNDIANIKIKTANGDLIPLINVVDIKEHSLPPQLLRYNRYSSATISASTSQGYSLGDGIDAMNEIASGLLDETFLTDLRGSSADYAEGSSSLIWVFIFALVLVYLTLSAQFESFRDPLTVMLTVPLALAGALLTLWIFGDTLNIFSQIGMIVLVGIVTKNGILIVEFANQKRDLGQNRMQAAINAANERVRPILMTSMATVLGALPLAISYNNTANSRMSLGLVIIGGLFFSLFLSLFVIPALYTYISNKNRPKIVDENE